MNSKSLSELCESNEARDDVQELRRRLEEDGYLFFRQLIDPEQLMQVRRQMLTVMQQGGWLVAGTDPVAGIAAPDARCTEGDVSYTDVYHQVYRLQSFHEVAHCREVLDLLEDIRGCAMMPHPQKVARLWFPQFTQHTTPTHQDFVHFQGHQENLTCWSPVGDCPRELGGLAVLRGSHKVNQVLEHHFSLGAGSLHLETDARPGLDGEWLTADYRIGDTLIFPFLTVHKALPNLTENRLRVSLDNRYQRIGDPIAEHMLNPHLLSAQTPLTWEEVYSDWDSDEFQYYWTQFDNPVLPKITSYLDQAFDEAVQLAETGDERAKLHLHRAATRNPETQQGMVAAQVLAKLKSSAGSAGPRRP